MTFDPNAAAGADSGVFGLPTSPEEARVVLVPVPFEATTSYGGGTVDGPAAVLEASRQVDLFDLETGRPYEAGIAMLPSPDQVRAWNDEARSLARPVIDEGGASPGDPRLVRVDALCEQMNGWVYETTRAHLAKRKLVGVVGGDHSTPFGCIRAVAEEHPGLGILHLDAHADLRRAFEGFEWSHASIMYNVLTRLPQVEKLVQVGVRDFCEAEYELIQGSNERVQTFFDATLARNRLEGVPWSEQITAIVRALPEKVYLSFDIDGLDPTLCPHTGTPVPGGLSFYEATALVAEVVRSGRRIVGFDLNEVAPGSDGPGWDGNVGARLLYKVIGWAVRTK